MRTALLPVAACLAALALTGCGSLPRGNGKLQVVAAENVWGSIAAQLGGDRTEVRSIVSSPATDPHSYEPTASDARAMAISRVAIVNGIGYDPWASQLVAANPSSHRVVVTVGDVLGLTRGSNPHVWYSPPAVRRVIDAISAAYVRADPGDARYFAARKRWFEQQGLARYDALLARIRRRYAGVPVGYSESIFTPLGAALRLRLLTPSGFATAVAEGDEVSLQDSQAAERQLRGHRVAVWVFNSQNVTPEVDRLNAIAHAERIPVATVTETISPSGLDFQQWQVAQLRQLEAALRRATGR
jgi:zinc/manganese transport system substrate-binding protein